MRDLPLGGPIGLGFGKAKQTWPELQSNFAFLTVEKQLRDQLVSDDVCDAVVCALVARARDLEHTIGSPDDELEAGRREGWIHVSCEPSDLLTAVAEPVRGRAGAGASAPHPTVVAAERSRSSPPSFGNRLPDELGNVHHKVRAVACRVG